MILNFKKSVLLPFMMLAIVMVSCGKDENGPEAVAEKFLNHIENGEFKEAKAYCDDTTGSMIGMLESFQDAMPKKEDVKPVEILSSEVKDDQATVTYKGSKDEEEKITLKKIDGSWKISINKEDQKKEDKPGMESMEIEDDTLEMQQDSIILE